MAIDMKPGVTYRAAPFHPVKPGQVWASNHKGDREHGVRQHREVEEVWSEESHRYGSVVIRASVVTVENGKRLRPQTVRCTSRSIVGHRLVAEVPVGEGDDAHA